MAQDPYRYFRIEARELLERLGQGILAVEKSADAAQRKGLLRTAHTLKGAARVVKQTEIADCAHAIEDLLAPHRESSAPLPRGEIDELLRLADRMSALLSALGGAPASPATTPAAPAPAPAEEPYDSVRIDVADMDGLLDRVSEAAGAVSGLRVPVATVDAARRTAGELARLLAAPRGEGEDHAAERGLAALTELMSALELARRGLAAGLDRADGRLGQARDAADRLRLVPAGTIFPALERAVRDAAHAMQRRATLVATGGEHRLDAHVLADLRDALLHAVRNSVTHGIEPESVRVAAGKPGEGRIELAVTRRGARLVFTCRDDGRGIDLDAVRRVAGERGRLPSGSAPADAPTLHALLLQGGLTTLPAVSAIAGRGIGLDVVREAAARCRGEVRLDSRIGAWTELEIVVPVSLSSLPALTADAGGVPAALPLDAVRGTVRVAAADVVRSETGESVVVGGRALPWRRLAELLGAPATAAATGAQTGVLIEAGGERAVLGVDRLGGVAAVTVRPLPAWLQADPAVAGAALEANGRPRLVLDPVGLLRAVSSAPRAPAPAPAPRAPILVIDDSLTTRMLEQSILESAGYAVDLAVSGEEGLAMARAGRYGLFLVDVEMPGIDGFEFLRRARADSRIREVPAIMVTSRTSAEDRALSAELGARAYVVKGEFDQNGLLRSIRDLLG